MTALSPGPKAIWGTSPRISSDPLPITTWGGGKPLREALKAAQMPTPMLQPPPAEPAEPGANLKPLSSGDSIRSIVAKPGEKPKPKAGAKADMVEQLGPDYDDEDDVPPLL